MKILMFIPIIFKYGKKMINFIVINSYILTDTP